MSSVIFRILSGFAAIFTANWVTMLGATLVTASTVLIAVTMALGILGRVDSPYLGIVTFLILPGFFVLGLLIIPAGALWRRFRLRKQTPETAAGPPLPFPVLDFNNPRVRSIAVVVALLSIVNMLIIGIISYKGVLYTESVEFCGRVCHTVMAPEYTAYLNSPHSKVACVECHIGPGADWFAKSKLSGVRQVFAVTLNTYSRPIPSPVHELRPSKETCEECHWPEKFAGDRIRVVPKYMDDETNSLVHSVLLMHIGGGHGGGHGIHSWHIDPAKTTTYLPLDEQRQKIGIVRVTGTDGTVTEFRASDLQMPEDEIARAEFRTMDCIDCHNRPTHVFHAPAKAVDQSLAAGAIDASLPYIKRVGVEALESIQGAAGDLDLIAAHVRDFYAKDYPDVAAQQGDAIEAAIRELQGIYGRNVFPEMNVTWNTYPNNLGHQDPFPGCFRCHDDSHESKDGQAISGDCELCHTVLAWDEEDPEILNQLQLQ